MNRYKALLQGAYSTRNKDAHQQQATQPSESENTIEQKSERRTMSSHYRTKSLNVTGETQERIKEYLQQR